VGQEILEIGAASRPLPPNTYDGTIVKAAIDVVFFRNSLLDILFVFP
jgi:hypothetical protein